jgi:hypothetical protein
MFSNFFRMENLGTSRRVAQTPDFAGMSNTVGAPSLRVLCARVGFHGKNEAVLGVNTAMPVSVLHRRGALLTCRGWHRSLFGLSRRSDLFTLKNVSVPQGMKTIYFSAAVSVTDERPAQTPRSWDNYPRNSRHQTSSASKDQIDSATGCARAPFSVARKLLPARYWASSASTCVGENSPRFVTASVER